MAKKTTTITRVRSADTGRFAPSSKAKTAPKTHIIDRMKVTKKK